MSDSFNVDVAIVGGGIAGLWLLSHLRARGYDALLIEGSRLGQGQTIASQGFLYGRASYALLQPGVEIDPTVDSLMDIWRRCLAGDGAVDLSGVRQLSQSQYFWMPKPPSSWRDRLFFPFKRKPVIALPAGIERPAVLAQLGVDGAVYQVDEPVLDVASLLQVLAAQQREAIVLNQGSVVPSSDGTIDLQAPERNPVIIRSRWCVFTAGIENAALVWAPVKVRTLYMMMVRGKHLPDSLYAHCLGTGSVPRLTITSRRAADSSVIWYLGGKLVEESIRRRAPQPLREARRELTRLLPKLNLEEAQFNTFRVLRAEAPRMEGKGPGKPRVFQNGKVIAAWSANLTTVPALTEAVIQRLERGGLRPATPALEQLADWPRPPVASYPWDDEQVVWQ